MSARSRHAILGSTQVVGLIGWPVEHSVSPAMHNAAFAELGLDWCYVPLPVHPNRVPEALAGAAALGLRGFNATVPHKEILVPIVDTLTDAARAIGAVNTVLLKDGQAVGHNTDAGGFLRALHDVGFGAGCTRILRPQGCSALVLGAGGAARAVVYALAASHARVTILNRTPAKAVALAAEFSPVNPQAHLQAGPLDESHVQQASLGVDLVVNTTPLGMWTRSSGTADAEHSEASPWPETVPFPREALLMDLIYNPRETPLMRQALQAGARTCDGLSMLVHQGAEAFTLWTGQDAPVDVMMAACVAILGGE
jgi:shikimate dehydrogenase